MLFLDDFQWKWCRWAHYFTHTNKYTQIQGVVYRWPQNTHCRRQCSLTLIEHENVSFKIKGPVTLSINPCVYFFESNRSNSTKTQIQRMCYVPILYINVNPPWAHRHNAKVDVDADANVDAHCERTFLTLIQPCSVLFRSRFWYFNWTNQGIVYNRFQLTILFSNEIL